jgi:S-adenosylmethionine/arginine decarboxylase-like enzyme
MEMRSCPAATDKEDAVALIHNIVRDIDMELLATPHVYYVKYPRYNEGLTAIAPIKTSHIAFHFWKNPDRRILRSANGRCLLEFDIYTCGTLSLAKVAKVLHHLSHYRPTQVDATILNRKLSLTIDRHMRWSEDEGSSWTAWLDHITPRPPQNRRIQ